MSAGEEQSQVSSPRSRATLAPGRSNCIKAMGRERDGQGMRLLQLSTCFAAFLRQMFSLSSSQARQSGEAHM